MCFVALIIVTLIKGGKMGKKKKGNPINPQEKGRFSEEAFERAFTNPRDFSREILTVRRGTKGEDLHYHTDFVVTVKFDCYPHEINVAVDAKSSDFGVTMLQKRLVGGSRSYPYFILPFSLKHSDKDWKIRNDFSQLLERKKRAIIGWHSSRYI